MKNKLKNFITLVSNDLYSMNPTKGSNTFKMALAGTSVALLGSKMIFAANFIDKITSTLKELYGQIVGVSVVVWAFVCALCALMYMFSKNEKNAGMYVEWAKRATIAWVILNTLGLIVSYGKDLVRGGRVEDWSNN